MPSAFICVVYRRQKNRDLTIWDQFSGQNRIIAKTKKWEGSKEGWKRNKNYLFYVCGTSIPIIIIQNNGLMLCDFRIFLVLVGCCVRILRSTLFISSFDGCLWVFLFSKLNWNWIYNLKVIGVVIFMSYMFKLVGCSRVIL